MLTIPLFACSWLTSLAFKLLSFLYLLEHIIILMLVCVGMHMNCKVYALVCSYNYHVLFCMLLTDNIIPDLTVFNLLSFFVGMHLF